MSELYKLSAKMRGAKQNLVDNEGVITPELEKLLDETGLAIEDKVQNIGLLIRNVLSDVSGSTVERDRFNKRIKAGENTIEWLEGYVKKNMQNADMEEIKSELITAKILNNPPSCEIINEDDIPEEFVTENTNKSIDKRAITKVLQTKNKDGTFKTVKGARLVTGRTRVKIK